MLKLLFRVIFCIILALLAYDMCQTGSFNESQFYQFLKEKRLIENVEVLMREAKKFCIKTKLWTETNIPVYYNKTCVQLKPYFNLGQDLSLVFKTNVDSFFQHSRIYFDKNFPAFQNYMSVVLEETLSSVKESALILSKHLQSYIEAAVQYAKNMFNHR